MEGKKLLMLASEIYGGAERNLLSTATSQDIVLITQNRNLVRVFIEVFGKVYKDQNISMLVPLGRKNTLVALFLACLNSRVWVIYSIRATELQRGYSSYVLDRILLSFTNRVKIVSNSFAGALVFAVKLRFPVDRIEIAYNRQGVLDDDDSVLYLKVLIVGHNRPEKGYDRLPKLVADYRELGINMDIDIYGSGTENIGSSYGINTKGFLNSEDIPWDNYDALLNISNDEGLPTVFLEAGQRGIPIIAKRTSGVYEYVCEGLNGVIIDLNDNVHSVLKVKRLFPSLESANILMRHEAFILSTRQLGDVFTIKN